MAFAYGSFLKREGDCQIELLSSHRNSLDFTQTETSEDFSRSKLGSEGQSYMD